MKLKALRRPAPCDRLVRLVAAACLGLCALVPAQAQTLMPLSCEVIGRKDDGKVDNPGGGGGNMQVLEGRLDLAAGIARASAMGPQATRRRVAYSYRFGDLDRLLPQEAGSFAASSVKVQVIKRVRKPGEPPTSQLASSGTFKLSAAPRTLAFSGASRESFVPQVDGGSGGTPNGFPAQWTVRLRVIGLRTPTGAAPAPVATRIDVNCSLPIAAGG